MIRISQCIIVKNEEHHIERALNWCKGYVAEQIVVDTGSCDRTIEIAQKMGARVYPYRWKDNFSEAKNYAISKASGDWIIFLDADEYMEPIDAEKLFYFIAEHEREKYNVIQCALINLDQTGTPVEQVYQRRAFRNKIGIHYKGAIHEYLQIEAPKKLSVANLGNEVVILHTGYAFQNIEEKRKKARRNLYLLEKEYKRLKCQNSMLELYMAEAYELEEDYENALIFVKKAIKNKDGILSKERRVAAYQLWMYAIWHSMGEQPEVYEKIKPVYEETQKFSYIMPDFDMLMGMAAYRKLKYQESATYLERALKRDRSFTGSQINIWIDTIYGYLMADYQHLKQENKLIDCCLYILQNNKFAEEAIRQLIHILRKNHISDSEILNLLKEGYYLENDREYVFLLRIIMKEKALGLAKLMEQSRAMAQKRNENREYTMREERKKG